jgi:uridine kinase
MIVEEIGAHLLPLRGALALRVAVDGVDGVGKTTFADRLGQWLRAQGRQVIRSSVDGFHNPRAIRHRLGRTSPEGFYRDSYDYAALRTNLLDPLSPGGLGRYRTAVFDHLIDGPVSNPELEAPEGAALVVDGLFLHRPELQGYWDFSVYLDAPFEITAPRGAARGVGFGDPDPSSPSNRRYVGGAMIYFREARPQDQATVVVDYSDLSRPRIVRWRRSG